MPGTISPPQEAREQRVVLHGISWETYECLLADHLDASSPRFTYDQGKLEIMSPSIEHERLKEMIAAIADIPGEQWELEFARAGSTTFRRRDLERGTEPDSCFYLQNNERIRGKREIALRVDPPPDLVIEVEITRNMAVRWARRQSSATGWRPLRTDPRERGSAASNRRSLVDQSRTLTTLAWRRLVRAWARERRPRTRQ
jgi:Putative restriction endonuclease